MCCRDGTKENPRIVTFVGENRPVNMFKQCSNGQFTQIMLKRNLG